MVRRAAIFGLLAMMASWSGCVEEERSPAPAETPAQRLEASNRHHEWVQVDIGNAQIVTAYLVYPEVSKVVDSVVVIHENRGLNDWARSVGDELGKHGYVAICPDLLSGTGPDGGKSDSYPDSDTAREEIYKLDPDRITMALQACAQHVRELPTTTEAVSVMGFCWGGTQAFRLATNDPSLKLTMVFYGSPPEKKDMARINCPVFGFYGENDNRINSTISATTVNMAAAGKIYQPEIYKGKGVGHGFLRVGMRADADAKAKQQAQEAWSRALGLLK